MGRVQATGGSQPRSARAAAAAAWSPRIVPGATGAALDHAGSTAPAGRAPVDAGDWLAPHRRLAQHLTDAPHIGLVVQSADGSLALDLPPSGLSTIDLLPVDRLVQRVIETGETLVAGDIEQGGGGGAGLRSFVGVPVRAEGVAGAGCLYACDVRPRTGHDAGLSALVDLAAAIGGELTVRLDRAERGGLSNLVLMLGKAVENMQLGVTITDTRGRIVYTNPAEARMHGYAVHELIGRHARILGAPGAGRAPHGDHPATTRWTRETVNLRKDGSRFPVLLWSDLVTDAEGRAIGIVTCSEDVTERKRSEEALRDYALRDPLTGLPNRAFFVERLNQAIQRVRRDPAAEFAVLFLDLDRFKIVNDSLGHHVGDELLAVVAQRLTACVGGDDTVSRFGGDEFAILLTGGGGVDAAVDTVRRIHTSLAAPVQLHGHELFTSASVGVVTSGSVLEQPEYLWRGADMAMYRAKSRGTGQYEIFDRTMHADAVARLQLESDLRRAIERQEFRLHYQPVIDLTSGRVVGFEALLRWQHPTRGLLPPTDLIPVLEETGMIHRVGEWVLREGCRQLRAWRDERPAGAPLWVGINLSGKQLSQPSLLEGVEAVVREAGIEPHMLKLEITESAVIENTEVATRTLRRLKALGVQLFMDDFGTGYSSLSYLHRLPLDALKIDRSFVSQMVRGDRHSQLVRTIVQLARSVNLQVVAEGIETPEQLALLREFGCEFAQGYLFSHPLAPEQVGDFLATGVAPRR